MQRATEEEIKLIRDHLQNRPELPLDKPEQFLLELSEIPHFAERIACFVIQSEFNDAILAVRNKLSNIKAMCEVRWYCIVFKCNENVSDAVFLGGGRG